MNSDKNLLQKPISCDFSVATYTVTDNYCLTDNEELKFQDFSIDAIPKILPFLKNLESRTCDFTIGGIYMWIDYFKYQYCITNDTLFIIGREEDDVTKVAFSLPIGAMPLSESVKMVERYCKDNNLTMTFSAIPEMYVDKFKELGPRYIADLPHWSDYLYSAQGLATLSGKKFSKKRNHVNKFNSLYKNVTTEPICADNITDVTEFYNSLASKVKDDPMAQYEFHETGRILRNYFSFNFISTVLRIDGQVAGFMIGEIINDTLHAHIEKTNHEYEGASEYMNNKFINYALEICPELKYENRQDDAGDPGLRKSKLSYNPIDLLKKYNIVF